MSAARRLAFTRSSACGALVDELRGVLERAIAAGADHEVLTTALVSQLYGCGVFQFKMTIPEVSDALSRATTRVSNNLPAELLPS